MRSCREHFPIETSAQKFGGWETKILRPSDLERPPKASNSSQFSLPLPVTSRYCHCDFWWKISRLSSAFGGEIACRAPAFVKQLLTTWTMLSARSSKESLMDGNNWNMKTTKSYMIFQECIRIHRICNCVICFVPAQPLRSFGINYHHHLPGSKKRPTSSSPIALSGQRVGEFFPKKQH